jgi:hypothetical protein
MASRPAFQQPGLRLNYSADQKPRPIGVTNKVKFSPEEDSRLLELVQQYGSKAWNCIAAGMGNRNSRQCRERYNNYLDPSLRHDSWTNEEDLLLIEKVTEYGLKWNTIAKFFEDRSDIALRNRWQLIYRRVNRPKSSIMIGSASVESQQHESTPPVQEVPTPAKTPDAIPIVPQGDNGQQPVASIFDFDEEMNKMAGNLFHQHSFDCCWCGGSFF